MCLSPSWPTLSTQRTSVGFFPSARAGGEPLFCQSIGLTPHALRGEPLLRGFRKCPTARGLCAQGTREALFPRDMRSPFFLAPYRQPSFLFPGHRVAPSRPAPARRLAAPWGLLFSLSPDRGDTPVASGVSPWMPSTGTNPEPPQGAPRSIEVRVGGLPGIRRGRQSCLIGVVGATDGTWANNGKSERNARVVPEIRPRGAPTEEKRGRRRATTLSAVALSEATACSGAWRRGRGASALPRRGRACSSGAGRRTTPAHRRFQPAL